MARNGLFSKTSSLFSVSPPARVQQLQLKSAKAYLVSDWSHRYPSQVKPLVRYSFLGADGSLSCSAPQIPILPARAGYDEHE